MSKHSIFTIDKDNALKKSVAGTCACAVLLLSLAAAFGAQERTAGARDRFRALRDAQAEALPVERNAPRTATRFRLSVTVEGRGGSTRVLDSVFNENGQIIEATTRDANLAAIYRQRWGGVGDDAIACKDRCKHHLDAGNPEKYAVCWWGCMIFGVTARPDRVVR